MIALKHERIGVAIDPDCGGRLVSLRLDEVEVVPNEEVNQPDFERGCFPLAPWCGVLPGAGLPATKASMHGLVHSSVWDVAHADSRKARLSTSIGPGTPRPWPGRGDLELDYALDTDRLQITLRLRAVDDSLPASVGLHPWFLRKLKDGVGEARWQYQPSHRLVPGPTTWPRVPSTDLGDGPHDDLFIGLSAPPRISWPAGPTLELRSDAMVWVIYEGHPRGFCIEPWTGTDGPLREHTEPNLLAGETRALTLELVFLG